MSTEIKWQFWVPIWLVAMLVPSLFVIRNSLDALAHPVLMHAHLQGRIVEMIVAESQQTDKGVGYHLHELKADDSWIVANCFKGMSCVCGPVELPPAARGQGETGALLCVPVRDK